MAKINKEELREIRKQKFAEMEQRLKEMYPREEDSLFYHHPSEDRIVLSHALFWTMTLPQYFKSKLRKEKLPTVTTFSPRDSLSKLSSPLGLPKELPTVTTFSPRDSLSKLNSPLGLPKEFFLLLRQYQEEMLDAFLQDDDYFSDLLNSQDLRNERSKIESCNILYEMLPTILMSSYYREEKDSRKLAAISVVAAGFGGDMPEELANILLDDIDYHFNKVKCRQIELIMPKLLKIVESEMKGMRR